MSFFEDRPTYEDYICQGGRLEPDVFDRLIGKAWAYLDAVTLGGVNRPLPGAARARVNQAAFAVLEEYNIQERGGEVSRAENDGYSETYVTSCRTPDQRLYSAAALHLAATGLLYSGFGGSLC